MGMVGADVDQLRALARNLTQAAERLENMTGEVNSRLSSTPWRGQDSMQFRAQWQGQSLGLVRGVVSGLRDAAAQVERNASEQEQASAQNGDRAGLGGLITPRGSLAPQFGLLPPDLFNRFFGDPLTPFTNIRDFLNTTPTWPITWGTVIDTLTPLGPVLPVLDALGLAGDTTLSPDEKIVSAGNALTDLGGSVLKSAAPGPVGYLSGIAVAQWGDVAAQVAQADFSPAALETTGNYIASDPAGAFKAAAGAIVGYVPKLISNILP
ncbi:WXG100 family type VII secretion target [Mycobacterium sp. SMC-4]|uniref:WXG100 family type VII secretion target n=1 Tax=Mycobacterium sp. SMC-4 TaxID=2857059 RepID=UPI0021B2F60B|nr:WXG100 family type VII secretion target [Mycobacterium sp. SMC-4]UXA19102.1 WXG100 family type VII secretion target [Mycobacterium sp. SMC-4]